MDSKDPKAVIIDQLNLTFPNQSFINETTKILEQAGYNVDYYPEEKVTIELYKDLPKYNVVILRVHSVLRGKEISFFTSEYYDRSKYVQQQLFGKISKLTVSEIEKGKEENVTFYFGITSEFIKDLDKKFDRSIIIAMGCNGLKYPETAKIFVDNGAKVFIGWNGDVTNTYADKTTIYLLRFIFIDKYTYNESIDKTLKEIGRDPIYGSIPIYYPLENEMNRKR